ncbi:MAG: ABC transporter ATP-binding protein [Desulfurococcaceae archaeon]
MSIAIEAVNLYKTYMTRKRTSLIRSIVEHVEALKGVSFTVRYGEVVGLLGPNGAGKTTTLKILATLLLPDKGEAKVAGYDVVGEADKVRKNIGLMLTVEKGFYGKLTGRENLEYFAALYGIRKEKARKRINELIKLLELDKLGGDYKLYEEFSLGMKARLSLARALLNDAPVLLLDEPTLGLDPPSARKIRELVKELARKEGKAILYTTHNMFEAEIVCDRIILINKGQIVAEGAPSNLKEKIPNTKIIDIIVRNEKNKLRQAITTLGLKHEIKNLENNVIEIKLHVPKPQEQLDEIIKTIIKNESEIISVKIEEPTLEDVFIYFSEGTI